MLDSRHHAAGLVLTLVLSGTPLPATPEVPTSLEYIGRAALPIGSEFAGERIGGLSGITWDAAGQRLLALSDDPSQHGPARFYEIEIALDDGRLDDGDWQIVARHRLRQPRGGAFALKEIDPEGLALDRGGALFLSTEGSTDRGIAPFVAEISRDGRILRKLPVGRRFRPNRRATRGVRQNLGFESLTVSPDSRTLFAATETALISDGPVPAPGVGSLSRIVAWDLDSGRMSGQFAYPVAPLHGVPPSADAFRVNGLVDLLALSETRFLALEREFVAELGYKVVLYLVDLAGASDVSGIRGLVNADFRPVAKQQLIDFGDIGIPLANFEGMALGPRLPDGRQSLLFVVDDNFDARQSPTLMIGFAIDQTPLTISDLQGAAHRSPLEGRWVTGIEGVVTATGPRDRPPSFFLESSSPDGDPRTSEGIRVAVANGELPAVGASMRVAGRVVEVVARAKQLPVTTLELVTQEALAERRGLPPPVRLVDLPVPIQVDADGLTEFVPSRDAIDFWESLEGMRVEIPPGTASGPSLRFGEFILLPDGAHETPRSGAGGELLVATGPSLRRVFVSGRLAGGLPPIAVGDRIEASIEGIVDYSFSNYKVLATGPVVAAGRGATCTAQTTLAAAPGTLTLATANLENLSAVDPDDRFELAGRVIAKQLASPAIVALEEVMDDSGKESGDGIVAAGKTLGRLIAAISAAGGADYEWVAIDPELDREGGIPGGNIRVALLFDPDRVGLVRRGTPGPLDRAELALVRGRISMVPNPGRVMPASPAFTMHSGEGVRRSLAVEFTVAGEPLFVVANHWSSKYDDDRSYGAVQPPVRPTGPKRLAQAREIRAWIDRLLELDPRARAVVLDDLNDLPWSEAVEWISRPPLRNLLLDLPASTRYTYNFEGVAQAIDYVLVSPALAEGAEVDAVHRNSDCPDPVRASDHDPLVARVHLK